MRYVVITLLLLVTGHASAHEWVPTYPKLEMSYVPGILRARMNLFNTRRDVRFYELGVFDAEWNKVPFAANETIVHVKYLERKRIDVFIRELDKNRAVYICSKSKLLSENTSRTFMNSRICSKIK